MDKITHRFVQHDHRSPTEDWQELSSLGPMTTEEEVQLKELSAKEGFIADRVDKLHFELQHKLIVHNQLGCAGVGTTDGLGSAPGHQWDAQSMPQALDHLPQVVRDV